MITKLERTVTLLITGLPGLFCLYMVFVCGSDLLNNPNLDNGIGTVLFGIVSAGLLHCFVDTVRE